MTNKKIEISIDRKKIDEVYALHGDIGVRALVDMMTDTFKESVYSQINHNKSIDGYYDEVKKEVVEGLEGE